MITGEKDLFIVGDQGVCNDIFYPEYVPDGPGKRTAVVPISVRVRHLPECFIGVPVDYLRDLAEQLLPETDKLLYALFECFFLAYQRMYLFDFLCPAFIHFIFTPLCLYYITALRLYHHNQFMISLDHRLPDQS